MFINHQCVSRLSSVWGAHFTSDLLHFVYGVLETLINLLREYGFGGADSFVLGLRFQTCGHI